MSALINTLLQRGLGGMTTQATVYNGFIGLRSGSSLTHQFAYCLRQLPHVFGEQPPNRSYPERVDLRQFARINNEPAIAELPVKTIKREALPLRIFKRG